MRIGLSHLLDLGQPGTVAAVYAFQFLGTLPQVLPAEFAAHFFLVEKVVEWSELGVL